MRSSWCRRHLTPRQVLVENVCRAARTAFVDAGYAGLPGRHAVLVYVALLERHVDVVVDLGVQDASRTTEWANACRGLDASLRQPDVGQFATALRELGAVLARTYPRADDDRNELPDEMQHS